MQIYCTAEQWKDCPDDLPGNLPDEAGGLRGPAAKAYSYTILCSRPLVSP